MSSCFISDLHLDHKREDIKKKSVYGAFNQPALMCSNIVFPIENHEDLDEEGESERNNGTNTGESSRRRISAE